MWHVSSRSGEASCEQLYSVYLYLTFPSPDAMWCSFIINGLSDRAAILEVFKPVRLVCQLYVAIFDVLRFTSLSDACLNRGVESDL